MAHATVVNGVVTFKLTNYVDTHDNVHGSAFFNVRWNTQTVTKTGPVDLTFKAGGTVFHDTVNNTGTVGTVVRTQPQKIGFWVTNGVTTGKDALAWRIETPTGPFDQATLNDNAGAGQAIDCSTVTFRLGTNLNAAGAPTTLTTLPASKILSQSCSATGLTAKVGPALAGQIIRVQYDVNITDPNLSQYTNSVAVTVDSKKFQTISRTVKVPGAGGNGQGNTKSPTSTSTSPTSTSTSPTSTSTSPTSTSATSTSATSTSSTSTTSSSTSATSTSTSPTTTSSPTVSGVKLTASSSPTTLAFTGANIFPALLVSGLLVGAGILLLVGVQLPAKGRRH